MDQNNRRILASLAMLAFISLSGCEDTVTYIHNQSGGIDRVTTDSITGKETIENFLPPPPPPAGGLKSDAGRG
jgi:hypothetical protein